MCCTLLVGTYCRHTDVDTARGARVPRGLSLPALCATRAGLALEMGLNL